VKKKIDTIIDRCEELFDCSNQDFVYYTKTTIKALIKLATCENVETFITIIVLLFAYLGYLHSSLSDENTVEIKEETLEYQGKSENEHSDVESTSSSCDIDNEDTDEAAEEEIENNEVITYEEKSLFDLVQEKLNICLAKLVIFENDNLIKALNKVTI
jgi:hypothetical protein